MRKFKSVSVQVIDSDIALLLPNGIYEIKQMEPRGSRIKTRLVYLCVFLAITGIVGFGYFCPDKTCALTTSTPPISLPVSSFQQQWVGKPLASKRGLSYDDMDKEEFAFDIDSHDVMVFLHVQKTGGTAFGKHLVRDLDLQKPCTCPMLKKRCYCFRPHSNQSWLFSRYTTGWKCGLHADWTELTNCVDEKLDEMEGYVAKRRYFYITLLREPVSRYLSEYRHVQRGATWKNAQHMCGGRAATDAEIVPCYVGDSWEGVQLDAFMACESNLAANRQTRMLADLELVDCYNMRYMSVSDRSRVLLASAKRNLQSMAFFGLTEHQKMSQYIFEETFNLRFAIPFEQNNGTVSSHTLPTLTDSQRTRITHLNSLDVELYDFAEKLLFQRFETLKNRDVDFTQRYAHLGEVPNRSGVTEFDWDKLEEDSSTIYPNKV